MDQTQTENEPKMDDLTNVNKTGESSPETSEKLRKKNLNDSESNQDQQVLNPEISDSSIADA